MYSQQFTTYWEAGKNLFRIGLSGLILFSLGSTYLHSQDNTDADLFELSPFEVTAEESEGYMATSTLAGTRLKTSLEDVGSAISVYTKEFMDDVGATDNESLLIYGTSTEVGGVRGNYTGVGNGASPTENSLFVRPSNNTRVRGLAAADNTRNYYRSMIPFDSYNSDRVDIVRGANAILFGLGSPAGIINSSTQDAQFSESNTVKVRFGEFDSYRIEGNFNTVVLPDELAIRVALVNDETKFRQNPAWQHSKRIYTAGKWEPKSLQSDSMRTTIKFSYENGDITSNRPRMMTPQDRITPFFKSGTGTEGGLNGLTVNQYVSNYYGGALPDPWNSPADLPQEGDADYPYAGVQGLKGFASDGTKIWGMSSQQSANRNPWLKNFGNIFDGLVSYNNSYSPTEFMQTRYRVHSGGDILGEANGRWAGVSNYARYAELSQLPHWDLGVYKDRHLQDTEVFDYVNNLLEGPNKWEYNNFEDYQASFSQTFLGGQLGYDIGFDHQDAEYGQESLLNGANGNAINIDINEVLPDGSPNPNLGRAAITSNYLYGNHQNFHEMDQFRATAFWKIDLEDKIGDNIFGKILGSHTFTGFFADDEDTLERRSYARYAAPESFARDNLNADIQITGPSRRLNVVHYLSDSLIGQSWPTGLGAVDQVVLPVASGTMNYFDPTWNSSVDPDEVSWIDPFFPRGGELRQYNNPDNWTGWTNTTFSPMDATTDDIWDLYTTADIVKTKIESKAFVWQGAFWNNAIIPVIGIREDKSRSYSHQALKGDDFTVDVQAEDYRLPDEHTGYAEGTTETYSLVTHIDRLLPFDLPGNIGLSVFYNESENFQPAASRVNHLGQSIASPTGETEDYGFQITTADNKYSVRVNWYETKVQNATYEGGFASAWSLGWSTTMPWAYAMKALNKVEGFQVAGWNPEGGYSNAPTVDWTDGNTYNEQQVLDAFFDYFDSLPQEFHDAWNLKVDDAQWQIPGWQAGMGHQTPLGLAATSDNISEGLEVEFVANPTKNWRISLNLAKTEATRTNVGGDIGQFIEERAEAFDGAAGAVRLWGPNPGYINSARSWYRGYIWGDYQLAKLQEGSDAPEIRKWRANLVSNYNFWEGPLKGVNIGGSLRYMSGSIVGYPVIDNVDGETDFIWNIDNPYKSDGETRMDFWVGYSRKIDDGKVDWSIQLNVTDAFADDDLIPITVQPDGSYGALRIPPSTSWFITNTFKF